jgi:hypothetical protein
MVGKQQIENPARCITSLNFAFDPLPKEKIIHVSVEGDDCHSGKCPDRAGSDGPLRTVEGAQAVARALRKESAEPVTIRVVFRGGTYFLERPLRFTDADGDFGWPEQFEKGVTKASEQPALYSSVEPVHPVVYESYEGELAVISGGCRIEGFRETTVNGVAAWVAGVPGVRNGSWHFSQLWVNGSRRFRPVLPKEGEYRIERVLDACWEGSWEETVMKGSDRFGYSEGDINPDWKNLQDVEIVILSLWRSLRTKLLRVDPEKRIATMDRNSKIRLSYDFDQSGAAYTIENVFEALGRPGEWYLDRAEERLYYIPLPGESIATVEVIAPRLGQLVEIEGGRPDQEGGSIPKLNTARTLVFRNLGFRHTEWRIPHDLALTGQVAPLVPGAISLKSAHYAGFARCAVEQVGTYGMALEDNCSNVRIDGCTLRDLGAGGIKIWHGCTRNTVTDCEIADGGHLFPPAVGIAIGEAPSNTIVHNAIHDFTYSGISIGWKWGYHENHGGGNVVEWNHIHHIGKGKLSDMGGIYTLGAQPGTRLRYNHIHDVWSRTYGGWAIYTDEGSSGILIEFNCCHDSRCASFHQHYGCENIVQNNIFAFGKEGQIALARAESHRSFIFRRNLVVFDSGELLETVAKGNPWTPGAVLFQKNCYFHTGGLPVKPHGMTFEAWQQSGQDAGSIVADPRCADLECRDFTLAADSPLPRLGFIPFDLSGAGPGIWGTDKGSNAKSKD